MSEPSWGPTDDYARSEMSGIDPDAITTVSVHGEHHDLTVFDLWELVGESVRAEERES